MKTKGRMSAERLAEYIRNFKSEMPRMYATEIGELLVALKAEREKVEAQDELLINMSESLDGCNENNREFAKRFRADAKRIEKLEARLAKVKACQRYEFNCFTDHWVGGDDGEHMLAADVLKEAGGE